MFFGQMITFLRKVSVWSNDGFHSCAFFQLRSPAKLKNLAPDLHFPLGFKILTKTYV